MKVCFAPESEVAGKLLNITCAERSEIYIYSALENSLHKETEDVK